MNHLTDEQLNEYVDALAGTQVDRYTGTHVDTAPATRHLDTCPDCRARLEELRVVFTALESLPEIVPPRDLTQSILAQLPVLSELPIRSKWIFAAQSLAALGIFAWLASSFILPPEIATYQPPKFDSLLASLLLAFSSTSFEFDLSYFTQNVPPSSFDFPSSSFIFHLSSFDLQSTTLLLFLASAAVAWLVGNRFLLRAPERESRK